MLPLIILRSWYQKGQLGSNFFFTLLLCDKNWVQEKNDTQTRLYIFCALKYFINIAKLHLNVKSYIPKSAICWKFSRTKIGINSNFAKKSTLQVTHLSLNAFRGEIFIATAFLTKRHLSCIILKLSLRELHNHSKQSI